MTEYIVQIEESEKNMSERFVGQLRSYPELVRCKECKWHKPKYPGERPTCLIYLGGWHDDDYCSRAERKEE